MAKKKLTKKVTGLWNQSTTASHVKEAAGDRTEAVETPPVDVIQSLLVVYVWTLIGFRSPQKAAAWAVRKQELNKILPKYCLGTERLDLSISPVHDCRMPRPVI